MKVSVLGGGNEVGASCLHIQIAGTSLLIDAGMRMNGDDPLPALGMLESLDHPKAVLVTHAHADHIGALPIIHSLYPNIPVYATPPTADLMKIMMKDSYKILEQRCRETNTLPPYTEEQVKDLLNSILLFPASGELRVGNVKIRSFRAGHILGAVMFLIEGEGETIFITGDLSFKAGRTISGAQVPHHIQPDVLIMESTYGNRAHTDRNTEENRLAKHVSEVISNGGFVLIPAFALGRAQEVLLILQDYMDKGLIPEFPIYVDGLVTPISKIYNNYPHFLKGPVAYRIKNLGDAFIREGRCRAIHSKERESVLSGKPGCIVASSGMLIGGASSWYAERLVSNEKNAIFITGYQDEESPGRKLLNIADGIEDHIELNGTSYPVKCLVGKYGLSAHADANEMNRFIQTLEPTYTLLVHGDDEARKQLSNVIDSKFHPLLVENGETYPFEKRKSGKGVIGKRYKNHANAILREKIGSLLLYQKETEETYQLAICMNVQERTNTLICHTLKGKQIKLGLGQIKETICYWNRSIDELKEAAGQVLAFSRPYLESLNWNILPDGNLLLKDIFQIMHLDSIKSQLAVSLAVQSLPENYIERVQPGITTYKIDQSIKSRLTKLALPIQGLQVNPTYAMDIARNYMAGHPRFIRCGVDDLGTEKERLTIYFDFPHAVSENERAEMADTIIKETGWPIHFSESVRQDLLQEELTKLLGNPIQTPSIHLYERKVVVSISRSENTDKMVGQFRKITGFTLQFKGQNASTQQTGKERELFQSKTVSKRLENNQAMEETKRWAKEREITIYKTSIKQEESTTIMEVHFISPEIAKLHDIELEELSYRIGMPVTYAKSPKQNEIIRLTVQLLPSSWNLKKNPSIHMDKATVSIKLSDMPVEDEITIVSEKINQATGYVLEVKV
ncbi:MBL fold metallo-hydrolase [Metabacillus arenae]|uniref:MBL fold metallo-hydrolase n=1 Tax=Metabacillus arenae TaxID=2771434 RepID=A0A926NEU3_9BACI|nr:MBL fold metallo-hydrolase [Metabacillus arenae]MBD1379810.1 MBL fold metallo-hydrolase [Metabacillus arenae]